MSKETEELRSLIPNEILSKIRSQDDRVLRKIIKSLEHQKDLQIQRSEHQKDPEATQILIRLMKDSIRKGSVEIRTPGGAPSVANGLLVSRTAVCLVCPDFDTEKTDEKIIYKAGGGINAGIGVTGQKLLGSVGLIEDIGRVTGGLDLFVIYQASAESTITPKDKENIRLSSEAMRNVLTGSRYNFNPHFMVLDSDELIGRSRDLAKTISLTDKEAERLSKDREEIIRMRLGIIGNDPLTFDIKRQEAAFDIAVHLESENAVRTMIGKQHFVHLAVDSARFSGYYQNPAIAIGRNLHYKGD